MERDILKTGLVLALVCAIAAGSLALTQSVTSSVIAERQARELQEMLAKLLPAADMFEPVSVEEPVEGQEPTIAYYMGYSGTQVVGAVVYGQATGFGGPLRVLVAVDQQGSILEVSVESHSETVGIGTKATTADFLGQFNGFTPAEKPAAGSDVDLVQGATISSRAVTAAVGNALDVFGQFVLGTAGEDAFDLSIVPDGVYQGTAEGFNGDVRVEVTVVDHQITKVEVVSHNDTPEVAGTAVDAIPAAIVERQHWQVDAVSGATWTSNGIMEAVKNALPDGSLNIAQIADGQYEGEAEGFTGTTKVTVHVADGKLTDIEVMSHGDTADIAEPAFDSLRAAMLEQQAVEVDAISGATWSSGGFIDAVTNALQKAPLKP
ncbi:MAG: FMN-binding protein [Bacillota bacterium]|jgi:RnfABCDGE-type electron transport complex G subunit